MANTNKEGRFTNVPKRTPLQSEQEQKKEKPVAPVVFDASLYWSGKAHKSHRNNPRCYTIRTEVSEDIVSAAKRLGITDRAPILDIGCNVGRNLEYLRRAGFTNLVGVDVSPHALKFTKEYYPELAKMASFHVAKAQEFLPTIKGKGWVIVSSAVLLHIQPASRVPIWDWMETHADYAITIEPPVLLKTKITADGRFLGPVDVAKELAGRGFSIEIESSVKGRMQYYRLVGASRCSQ